MRRGKGDQLTLNHYLTFMTWDHIKTDSLWSNTSYSTLRLMFRFDRLVSNFVVITIGPTILILGVAYTSFWISVDSGPGRFLLTVLTMLSIVTQFASVRTTSMPPVSYVSAADVWFLVCMVFIFVAIVELAVVNFLEKKRKILLAARQKKVDSVKAKQCCNSSHTKSEAGNGVVTVGSWRNAPDYELEFRNLRNAARIQFETERQFLPPEPKDYAIQIDVFMRVAYPSLFLLFNIIYWPILYSLRSNNDPEQHFSTL